MQKIELVIQCQACKGTGLYIGMAERDGAAVVCRTCNGTGKYNYKFEYEEFEGLKKRDDVTRVYKQGYGFVITPKSLDFKGVGKIDMQKEGVSYSEFLSGKRPEHIRQLACPMMADQPACHDIKGFVDECENLDGKCLWGRSLSSCNYQHKKSECWERFYSAHGC